MHKSAITRQMKKLTLLILFFAIVGCGNEDGAISEVKQFNKLKVKNENSSKKVIGIEEIGKYLNGKLNLSETRERIYIKTRQYAKRQTTWARGQMKSWQKIDPKNLISALKKLK